MDFRDAVAISYAQDSIEYIEQVIGFVNLLREKYGYNAIMDKMLVQEQTAIDFNQMMSNLIVDSRKVIVLLSKKYKQKADSFDGGVGKEYRIILDEIECKTNKYIFATFSSLQEVGIDEIKPAAIGNREIIDLSEHSGQWEELISKLSDTPIYIFSEVANKKRKPEQREVHFKLYKSKKDIFRNAQIMLAENRQILEQYGPNSDIAIKNPLSSAAFIWKEKKMNTIIPNNKRIIDEFENNLSVFSPDEIWIFKKFKIHADAFEASQTGVMEVDVVPVFPKEFEAMINKEVD